MYLEEKQNSSKTFPISNQKEKDDFIIDEKHLFPLEEKITSLENNFVKIEEEYLNKIKLLQIILAQKTKKQVSLTSQVTNLRENFRLHKDEIKKLNQHCNHQTQKQVVPSSSKKNSRSYGIVRNSLDSYKKKIVNQSPSNTPKTKQTSRNLIIQNTKSQQNLFKTPMKLKNDYQAEVTTEKKSIYTTPFSNSIDKMQKSNELIINKNSEQKNEKINKEQSKRKSFSPKIDSKLKRFLFKPIKNVQPQRVKMPIYRYGSPKRIFMSSNTSQIKNIKNMRTKQAPQDKEIEVQDFQDCL